MVRALEPSEAQIEMAICHYLAANRLFFWKQPNAGFYDSKQKRFRRHVNPYVRLGVPDIMLIYKGRFVGLEVKAKSGAVSQHQKLFADDVKKAGGHCFIVRSVHDVEKALALVKELV